MEILLGNTRGCTQVTPKNRYCRFFYILTCHFHSMRASAPSSAVGIILNLFLSIYFILIHAFSCLQTTPLCSVWEGFFLLIMSYKIISLDPIHPSLRLPICAPSLSINFFYFFLQLCCVPVASLQPKLPFLRSALWWTCCPMLTVIHSASRQPAVASSLDRLSSIPMTVHRILSWWKWSEAKGRLIFEWSLYRWCKLCGRQHTPLSPPRHCHPCKQVDQACHCHSVAHIHRHTEARKHTHTSSQTNTWQVWVTAAHTVCTPQTQPCDRDDCFYNNTIKSYNDCLQEVSEAIMLSGGWRI